MQEAKVSPKRLVAVITSEIMYVKNILSEPRSLWVSDPAFQICSWFQGRSLVAQLAPDRD